MANFVDRVVLHVASVTCGNVKHDAVNEVRHGLSIRGTVSREKFKPLGGPDGGNGGRGGNIVLVVDPQSTTLLDYHHSPHRKATKGQPGGGDDCNGADGGDLILPVPAGTVVKGVDGEVIVDLVAPGESYVVARGGRGGLGNRALSSRARKAPGFALLGESGDILDIVLELKSLADVALIGYPSAGKSSIVSVLSAARPKIADYPFTTLAPNLGVVVAGDQRFTVADVPGLIPGASEGKRLGLEFLRHVERCSVLVHVIACATLEPDRDIFRVIGERTRRWIVQTDFSNDEAVGYLADWLVRAGVEQALFKAGAVAGATVVIGAADNSVVFDWEPTMAAGAELLTGPRGSDVRLDNLHRPTREEKRSDYAERRAAKTAARDLLQADRKAGHWATAGTSSDDAGTSSDDAGT